MSPTQISELVDLLEKEQCLEIENEVERALEKDKALDKERAAAKEAAAEEERKLRAEKLKLPKIPSEAKKTIPLSEDANKSKSKTV